MTTPTIKFNTRFPPAQERSIRLALEQGLVSDKAQARAEGLSPRSVGNRWDNIAYRLRLAHGQKDRARILIELVVRKHIEVAILLAAILAGSGHIDKPLRPRTPTGSRPIASARASARRPEFDLEAPV